MKKKVIFGIGGTICLILFLSIIISAEVTVVPATCFKAEDGSGDFGTGSGGWGDYVYRTAGATENYAVAPVYLPDSVLIRNFRAHFMENDAVNDMFVCLTRVNKYTGTHNVLYSLYTSGASSSVRYATDYSVTPSPGYALTNLGACNYHACIGWSHGGSADMRFYGITITWTPYP